MKFDCWLALILTFSPGEKERLVWRSDCANNLLQIQRREFQW